jgi:hypothetical protein
MFWDDGHHDFERFYLFRGGFGLLKLKLCVQVLRGEIGGHLSGCDLLHSTAKCSYY